MKLLRDMIYTSALLAGFCLFFLLAAVLFSGCGKQDLVLSGEATINHKVSLDTAQLIPMVIDCIRENPNYSNSQIEECVANKIAGLNS